MLVWSLEDERIGSSKQAKALAQLVTSHIVVKKVVYNFLIRLPNFLKPDWMGIDFQKSDQLLIDNTEEIPQLIIFAGRRLAGIAIFLKKFFQRKFSHRVRLIAILNPNYSFKKFDLIVLPTHDSFFLAKAKNIKYVDGAICGRDFSPAVDVVSYWQPQLESFPKPFFSWIIGGDIKKQKLDPHRIGLVTEKISNFVNTQGGTLLVTTSRRTSDGCSEEIKAHLACTHIFYNWSQNYTHIPNPYYYFLEESEIVFATEDSISMIAEIVALKKPLYIYIPREFKNQRKHKKFSINLVKSGKARFFDADKTSIINFHVPAFSVIPIEILEYITKNLLIDESIINH
jgi:mitochondrial fission protein ELM1